MIVMVIVGNGGNDNDDYDIPNGNRDKDMIPQLILLFHPSLTFL